MTDIYLLRQHMPETLPWAVRELIISNFVVGNYSLASAVDLSFALERVFQQSKDNAGRNAEKPG